MDFYRIKEEYNQFLQKYEKEKRGITKVPNIKYTDRNKFAFGTVYEMVTTNAKQILTDNSCDFKLLEQAYHEYINQAGKQ